MDAHVFREALLRRMADIQTAEVYSNCQGNTLFQTVGNRLHRTPRCLVNETGLMSVGGGNDRNIIRLPGAGFDRNSRSALGHGFQTP